MMTKEVYERVTGRLREDEKKADKLKEINKILTGFVFLIYPLYLLMLYWNKDGFLVRAIVVPAVSFVAVTIFRKIYNAPRPYEKFGLPPVIDKDTEGKSFPSRHVFSVFVIAMTVYYGHPGAGVILAIVGVALAVIRVVGGVHEPRDVVAGALVGIAAGVIGYYLV
jgi:membrane-associated phospholipid phosphatase